MKKIIVDSCIWISAFIAKDKYHENGKNFWIGLTSKRI